MSSRTPLVLTLVACTMSVAAGPERQPRTAVDPRLSKMAADVTIYRDTYGVPHVYGPTDDSVLFGFTYARAEDEFSKVERNYIRALGRTAEVNGPGGVPWDSLVRAFEIERLSKAGVRARVTAHPGAVRRVHRRNELLSRHAPRGASETANPMGTLVPRPPGSHALQHQQHERHAGASQVDGGAVGQPPGSDHRCDRRHRLERLGHRALAERYQATP